MVGCRNLRKSVELWKLKTPISHHRGKFTTNEKVEICVGDKTEVWEDLDKDIFKLDNT